MKNLDAVKKSNLEQLMNENVTSESHWRVVQARRIEAVEKAVQVIADAVNGMAPGDVANVILSSLVRQHRTLQQSTFAALLQALGSYKEFVEDTHDARNQFAVSVSGDLESWLISKWGKNWRFPLI